VDLVLRQIGRVPASALYERRFAAAGSERWAEMAEVVVNEGSEPGDLARGAGFGRGGGPESLAARWEAAQRRLSSSLRQAEMVDRAVRMLDEQLTEYGVPDENGSLHATARALLTIAYGTEAYDVTFVSTAGQSSIRVRHTAFALEAEVVPPPSASRLSPVPAEPSA
jgi:hypothetical protein